MAAIQNIKNFIRHGKQARANNNHAEPTTNVSQVHAQQYHAPAVPAHSEPGKPPTVPVPGREPAAFSMQPGDNRHNAAKAGLVAANAAAHGQYLHGNAQPTSAPIRKYNEQLIHQLVAEERHAHKQLPVYPGLERWVLVEKMGDGAFSNVYRARDKTGEFEQVAIKVVRKFELNNTQGDKHLHPNVKKQPKTVERANILKEVQIMRQLDHPNIVKLISFSESRQHYFLVLELCQGGELFHQIVRLTYFSEDLSRHVITQVAEGLLYLHEEKGVVHRDIKPENLLFDPIPFIASKRPKPRQEGDEDKADEGEFIKGVGAGGIGRIKIADFGLSKVVWDSVTMTPCGTVGYTAPEIVKDERYSKSVDMWAMGCVLYTLLCGFPPFYDESISILTEKVAKGQYTFLSPWWDDISKSAQDLVSHLLTVDPEKRYTIKQFLDHPWIRQTNEATTAADDAPPLATPAAMRNPQLGNVMQQDNWNRELETPGGGRGRADFRSPGAINLREVFDVGYAVLRQEEENKNRRKNRGQGGFRAGLNQMDDLDDMDEEEEDEYQGHGVNSVERGIRNLGTGAIPSGAVAAGIVPQTSAAAKARQMPPPQAPPQERGGYGQHSAAVVSAAKQQVKRRNKPFELSLDNATMLGRRKGGNPSNLRGEVVM